MALPAALTVVSAVSCGPELPVPPAPPEPAESSGKTAKIVIWSVRRRVRTGHVNLRVPRIRGRGTRQLIVGVFDRVLYTSHRKYAHGGPRTTRQCSSPHPWLSHEVYLSDGENHGKRNRDTECRSKSMSHPHPINAAHYICSSHTQHARATVLDASPLDESVRVRNHTRRFPPWTACRKTPERRAHRRDVRLTSRNR